MIVDLYSLTSAHMGKLREWRNASDVYNTCRQSVPVSDVAQESWFTQQGKDTSIQMYSILTVPTKQLVGVCGLTSIDTIARHAELSLFIGHEWRKKGYAAQSLQNLLSQAFNVFNLNSVWAEIFETNDAGKKIYSEKYGFTTDGIRPQYYYKDGKYIDAYLRSITREEFFKRKKEGLLYDN